MSARRRTERQGAVGSTNRSKQAAAASPRLTPLVRAEGKDGGGGDSSAQKKSQSSDLSQRSQRSGTDGGDANDSNSHPKRHLQTSTWTKALVPDAKGWQAESSSLGKGELTELDKMVENALHRELYVRQHKHKFHLQRAKDKLKQLAEVKFGSARNMFRTFDTDQSGRLSLDEFSRAMKRRNLQTLFPRDQQRLIFQHVDKDHDEELTLAEILEFLDESGGVHTGRSEDELSENDARFKDPEALKLVDFLIDTVVEQRRYSKQGAGSQHITQHLVNAFRQFDEDGSGALTEDELAHALGPRHLNLDVTPEQVTKLFRFLDKNGDGEVSHEEFIGALQIQDPDPDFDPVFDGRMRRIVRMKRILSEPTQFPDAIAAEEAYRTDQIELLGPPPESSGPETSSPSPSVRGERPNTLDSADDDNADRFWSTANRLDMTQLASPVHLDGRRRLNKLESSQELFDDIHNEEARARRNHVGRFRYPAPTDWSRTGLGGDGVDESTALFLSPRSQFRTTSSLEYPALNYQPNQPVSRDLTSTADEEATVRNSKREARQRRKVQNINRMERRVAHENLHSLRIADARMRAFMGRLVEQDQQRHHTELKAESKKPLETMQRKPVPEQSERMWGGSKYSPFHQVWNQPDAREFSTTYRTDFLTKEE